MVLIVVKTFYKYHKLINKYLHKFLGSRPTRHFTN